MGNSMDSMKSDMAMAIGDTKTVVDPGDATEMQVADMDAFNKRMNSIAETAGAMRPQMPNVAPVAMPPQQVAMPAPQMGQMPNPYAPVSYNMPQQPMGGIGSVPSMEQILRALQSQQR